MAGTLKLYHEGDFNSVALFGDRFNPESLSFTNDVVFAAENIAVAATHGTAVLWTNAQAPVTFAFGVVLSSTDLWIEIKPAHTTPQYVTVFVPANVPFWFGNEFHGGTVSIADGTAITMSVTGDADSPASIKVQNETAVAATASLFLFS